MSAVGIDQEATNRKAGAARRPESANSIMNSFRRFWLGLRSLRSELLTFPVRIWRIDSNLIAVADLPGLKKEEIRVELTDTVLVIEADPNREGEAFFRRAGRRVIPLPDGAGIDRARAQLKNGVLTVSLPVWNAKKGREVPVEEVIDIEPPTN